MCWRCWLGGRKGIWPVKTEWWGAGMVICLERGANLHIALLMPLPLTVSHYSKIQICFTFLVPAYPGSLGKSAGKRVCVCVCVCVRACVLFHPGLSWVAVADCSPTAAELSGHDLLKQVHRKHSPPPLTELLQPLNPISAASISLPGQSPCSLALTLLSACLSLTLTRLMAFCLGLPGWAGTRKVKPIWILLKRKDDESQVLKGNLTWL